jgi:hypothetical protein
MYRCSRLARSSGQFRNWLQSIANDRNIDEKGLAGMDWLARPADRTAGATIRVHDPRAPFTSGWQTHHPGEN